MDILIISSKCFIVVNGFLVYTPFCKNLHYNVTVTKEKQTHALVTAEVVAPSSGVSSYNILARGLCHSHRIKEG